VSQKLELRRFASDSSYNFIRQGWALGLGLLISVLLSRGLGTEARGIYSVVLLLPTFLVTFLNLGIGPATTYHIGRDPNRMIAILRNNLALSIWISAFSIVTGVLLILFAGQALFPGAPQSLLLLSLAAIPITLQQSFLITIFQGLEDFKAYNLVLMTPHLIMLALVILLIWVFPLGVLGALLAYLGGNLTALLVAAVLLWKKAAGAPIFSLKVERSYAREMLDYGLRSHFANILAFFNYRADVFLLNLLAGAGPVGIYSVAVAIGERLWLLPNSVSTVLLPRIASMEGSEKERKLLTPMMSRYVLWFSLLLAIPVFLLANWGIVLLYSEEFAQSALALRLLLPGIVAMSVTKILANDISGRGHPGINSYQSAVTFAVNVILNLFLIPRFGVSGVAVASSISYSLLAILKIITYFRMTNVSLRKILLLDTDDIKRIYRSSAALALEAVDHKK
jgi:O-antigen/teichoic acid export membrane protein